MSNKSANEDPWTIEDAAEVYGIRTWGLDYFGISAGGDVVVQLRDGSATRSVSLREIVEGLGERGTQLPVLLRFADLLDSQIEKINRSFREAIRDQEYGGNYRGVFPIKVNQQQQVIKEVTRIGREFHYGLEAGSKPELLAALAFMRDPEAYIICNGYKDVEFIDLAFYGRKMGLRTMLVIEMPGELDLILQRAEALGVEPELGVRVRLSSEGSGNWARSGGDRSVFGLNVTQVIGLVDELRERNMLGCLKMLHYHQGSQIPNIRSIRRAASEAVRVYCDLVLEGAPMGVLNLGGGLAVDYDGSKSDSDGSANYGIEEYCADMIELIKTGCDDSGVAHPDLVTESGRAAVAYYSVLVFNVLDASGISKVDKLEMPAGRHEVFDNLVEVSKSITADNLQECYNDALFYRDKLSGEFLHGDVRLRERAAAEQLFWEILTKISAEAKKLKFVPEDIQDLDSVLSDFYYGNFSLFQSLPDSWAIDQLFPVMPIHRLDKRPTRNAIIADITCDCDGRIDRFIDLHEVKTALPMHEWKPGEEYMIGVFLVGAYQETLGDLHNLFGDTNVVSVEIKDGRVNLNHELDGDSVADVLSYVEYDPRDLVDRFRELAESAVKLNRISPKERKAILDAFREGLQGYTYFEK